MVNRNHLRVLIRKDGLTLKRNIIFFLSFVILPVIMIAGFSFLQSRIASEYTPLQHNFKRKYLFSPLFFINFWPLQFPLYFFLVFLRHFGIGDCGQKFNTFTKCLTRIDTFLFSDTTYTKKNKLWDSFMNSTMKY